MKALKVNNIKQFLKKNICGFCKQDGQAKAYLLSSNPNVDVGSFNFCYPGSITIHANDNKVSFGKYCAIGENFRVIAENHNIKLPALQIKLYMDNFNGYPGSTSKGPVVIGSDVWVGDNVTILSGVNVGDGAVIGTGSIVTKNIPPYAVVGGIPAKLIKYRFEKDVINFLLDLRWWDWDEGRIKRNKGFFLADLSETDSLKLQRIIRK